METETRKITWQLLPLIRELIINRKDEILKKWNEYFG